MDRNRILSLVFPLADALQFSLYLCHDQKLKRYSLKGYGTMGLPLSGEHDIPFKCRVVASAIGEKESYVVIEVMGDLYAMLAFDAVMGELTFALLDGAKMLQQDTMNHLTVKQFFDRYMGAIVGLWLRTVTNDHWSRLDALEAVDPEAIPNAEKAHRPDHRLGQGRA